MSCKPYFDCQLDYARQAAASYLPDTCEIYEPPSRLTATRTAEGDIDDTYPTNWTKTATVACLVRLPKLRDQLELAGQPIAVMRPTILLPVDTVLTAGSRIKVTISLNSLLVGQSFNVIASPVDSQGSLRIAQVGRVE